VINHLIPDPTFKHVSFCGSKKWTTSEFLVPCQRHRKRKLFKWLIPTQIFATHETLSSGDGETYILVAFTIERSVVTFYLPEDDITAIEQTVQADGTTWTTTIVSPVPGWVYTTATVTEQVTVTGIVDATNTAITKSIVTEARISSRSSSLESINTSPSFLSSDNQQSTSSVSTSSVTQASSSDTTPSESGIGMSQAAKICGWEIVALVAAIVVAVSFCLCHRRRRNRRNAKETANVDTGTTIEGGRWGFNELDGRECHHCGSRGILKADSEQRAVVGSRSSNGVHIEKINEGGRAMNVLAGPTLEVVATPRNEAPSREPGS
jgi:hypothetical protein